MIPYIYLASQSPRRQELLKQMGVQFEMLLPAPGEDAEAIEIPLPNEKARAYVERVTLAKSAAALARWQKSNLPWAPILCADTTVSLPNHPTGEILGKPSDAEDARRVLSLLSGKTHEVLTAVAITLSLDSKPACLVQVSEVEFSLLSTEQMKTILPVGSPLARPEPMVFRGLVAHSFPRSREVIAVSWVFRFSKPRNYSLAPK